MIEIYLLGSVIWTLVVMQEFSMADIIASVVVGLLWPITIPVRLLRGVFS